MIWSALSTDALVSKENRASTSVETLPGMILRISLPNATRSRSSAASTLPSRSLALKIFSLLPNFGGNVYSYMIFAIFNRLIYQFSIFCFL